MTRTDESLDDLWPGYDKAVDEGSEMWKAEFRRRIEAVVANEAVSTAAVEAIRQHRERGDLEEARGLACRLEEELARARRMNPLNYVAPPGTEVHIPFDPEDPR